MSRRRKAREIAIQGMYIYHIAQESVDEIIKFDWLSGHFTPDVLTFAQDLIINTINDLDSINEIISKFVLKKHLERMSIVDRSILQFSIFSLFNQEDIHHVIIINEAVDLSKVYGEEGAFKLINGALDNIRKELCKERDEKSNKLLDDSEDSSEVIDNPIDE